jgi:ribosomal protein L7Ae-like RNA K-turn-binding protein
MIDWRTPVELHRDLKMIAESLVQKDRMNFVVRNCSERMLKILKTLCEDNKIPMAAS